MTSKRHPLSRQRITEEQRRAVLLMAGQTPPPPARYSVRQIAKELGLSKTTVQDILKPRTRRGNAEQQTEA